MARSYTVVLPNLKVRAGAFKMDGCLGYAVSIYSVRRVGEMRGMGPGQFGNAGEVFGRNGRYTTGGANVEYRVFERLQDAVAYVVTCWVAAQVGQNYAVQADGAKRVMDFREDAPGMDLDAVEDAIRQEVADQADAALAAALQAEDKGVNVSTDWLTAEHARQAFAELAKRVPVDQVECDALVYTLQTLAGSWRFMKAAEGTQEVLALPEKAGNRQHWCANCGQPATRTRRTDFTASGTYQQTLPGAAILKVGGSIGRYCPACAPVYQFLALPAGHEPQVELDHLTEMTRDASARQAQAMALLDGAADPEFRIAALRAVGQTCHVLAELAARFLAVHQWPPYHQPWHDRHISWFALNRVERVPDGGQVTISILPEVPSVASVNMDTYEVTEWEPPLDNGGGDLVLY